MCLHLTYVYASYVSFTVIYPGLAHWAHQSLFFGSTMLSMLTCYIQQISCVLLAVEGYPVSCLFDKIISHSGAFSTNIGKI